jgi:outer membrane protein assembly factor BamB
VPAPLPVWASPALTERDVFVPVGNGRLTMSEPPPGKPAGALLRLDADTGKLIWRVDSEDGVLAPPVLDWERVYFVSRDGHCYAFSRGEGAVAWIRDMGSPAVAAPALAWGELCVVGTEGQLALLHPESGRLNAAFDFGSWSSARPRLLSAPAIEPGLGGERWVYVGTELRSAAGAAAILFCLADPAPQERR